MRVVRATAADAAAIAQLHASSWRTAYRGMYRDEYLDGDIVAERTVVWQQRFEAPADNQLVLLAKDGEDFAGFVCAYGNHDPAWGTLVDNLHVRLNRQRHGVGRLLLGASAAWSQEHYPNSALHLWVFDGNAKARRFYASLGGEAYESTISTPPGGGAVKSWRYVWRSLESLLAEAPEQRSLADD